MANGQDMPINIQNPQLTDNQFQEAFGVPPVNQDVPSQVTEPIPVQAPIVESPVPAPMPAPVVETQQDPNMLQPEPVPTPGFAQKRQQAIEDGLVEFEKQRAVADEVLKTQQQETDAINKSVQEADSRLANIREEVTKTRDADFWGDKSTGQKILAGISIMLGGLSQGLTGARENAAMNIVMKQKQDFINKQNRKLDMLAKQIERTNMTKEAKQNRLEQIRMSRDGIQAKSSMKILDEIKRQAERTGKPLAQVMNTPLWQEASNDVAQYHREVTNRNFQREINNQRIRSQEDLTAQKIASQQQLKMAELKSKKAEKQEKLSKEEKKLDVPGFGLAKTEKEAIEARQGLTGAKTSIDALEEIKTLGTDVAVWDRKTIGKINTLLNKAIGALRLSLVGPGAMSDSERKSIRETIGDPSSLFSTEGIEKAKLDQLISSIKRDTVTNINGVLENPTDYNPFAETDSQTQTDTTTPTRVVRYQGKLWNVDANGNMTEAK